MGRRTSTVDELLERARARIERVQPVEAARRRAAGALLVDTRPLEQRDRDGEVPGAVVVDRNVLEWRLDPASPHRIPEVTGYDLEVIVLCNQGYSSSLVADTLRSLGLSRAVDVIGGFEAWAACGLPVAARTGPAAASTGSAAARTGPAAARTGRAATRTGRVVRAPDG